MQFSELLARVRVNAPIAHTVVHGAHGGALPWLLAQTLTAEYRPLCIICPTLVDAQELAADVECFTTERSSSQTRALRVFPERALPFDALPTPSDLAAQRLHTLHALTHRDDAAPSPTIITTITACLQALPSPTHLRAHYMKFGIADIVERDVLYAQLQTAGFLPTPLVEEIGTCARRGLLIDVWPAHTPYPCRIEFDGDLVASVRYFDPATQRSRDTLTHVAIGVACEIPYTADARSLALEQLRAIADEHGLPFADRESLFDALARGRMLPEFAGLASIFLRETAVLRDFLPHDTHVVWIDPLLCTSTAERTHERLHKLRAAAPTLLQHVSIATELIAPDVFSTTLRDVPNTFFHTAPTHASDSITLETRSWPTQEFSTATAGAQGFSDLAVRLNEWLGSGYAITLWCHTPLAADRALDLLKWNHVPAHTANDDRAARAVRVAHGSISRGFVDDAAQIIHISEEELFGKKIHRTAPKPRASSSEAFLVFQDLTAGDCIVHEQHGIGRFLGLQHMTLTVPNQTTHTTNDFVELEYLGGDKLYLPVYRLHLLQRYIAPDDATVLLDKLGGARWSAVKKRALQSIRTMAGELLKIYATRQTQAGTAFAGRDHLLEEFESHFPYDETPDQWQAIEDVLRDMQHEKPMDRLVCGDVGYGKTEVALRAAFRAATDGKQVALLCPTTLLADQHYQTFAARFANTPISIELLNRFRSPAEQKAIVARAARGELDIVIGTHRLIQQDVKFPRLGLLIIDEEQRFGVAHKERLRKLRATVDTLTLTATPIPRTLHGSLSGLRDISIIQTPPADRRAVRTHVVPFRESLVQEALRYELARGGQIFFLHNRVQTIASMADRLRRLVPEARITVAHGQMNEEELENTMHAFIAKKFDVLLCTTIIEAGLDIPSANTLIVNRADTFGLAQLYQLRGRVGRSSVQAAAYFLTPSPDEETGKTRMTPSAERRLATLARYTELGSGFTIAMHDLEMRGAGNMLGAEQSGHIAEIGYELFTKLLERTIRNLKGEPEEETVEPEIQIPVSAILPESYIEHEPMRLAWYRRLSDCKDRAQLDALASELQDRFGPLPTEAHQLLQVIDLRLFAVTCGIEQIQHGGGGFKFKFHASTKIPADKLFRLVNREPKRYSVKPDGSLFVRTHTETLDDIFTTARELLMQFSQLIT